MSFFLEKLKHQDKICQIKLLERCRVFILIFVVKETFFVVKETDLKTL